MLIDDQDVNEKDQRRRNWHCIENVEISPLSLELQVEDLCLLILYVLPAGELTGCVVCCEGEWPL